MPINFNFIYMLKKIFTPVFVFIAFNTFSQVKTEWREDYKISLSDFQAQPPKSRDNVSQSFYLAGNLDFGYAMSNYEFMLTKNFNKHVAAFFVPANSWIQEGPQTEHLQQYAQMQFDLLELYARKYRKQLYESKGALSNYNFFQQAHDQINAELIKRQVEMQDAALESEDKRAAYHQQIRKEISEMPDFCKECKPTKVKRKDK
jgi:hypothetical protein